MNTPGESLDLRTIPAAVISLVSRTDRRAHITSHFGDLGLNYRFVDGVAFVTSTRHPRGGARRAGSRGGRRGPDEWLMGLDCPKRSTRRPPRECTAG